MLMKTAFGLALVLATASGTLASSKHDVLPNPGVHHPQGNGASAGTDPGRRIRFELNRDWDHGRF